MPVTSSDLEAAIRARLPDISHLEIRDDSDGCGDKYVVLIVSQVMINVSALAAVVDVLTHATGF